MCLFWISLIHLIIIGTKAQFNQQEWQHQLPYQQQLYNFKSNSYQTPSPISVQQPLTTFTIPESRYANQYVGYVTVMGRKDDIMSSLTTEQNDYSNIVHVKSNLPDFLRGTSDDLQKNFYKIVSNPNETFRQKQNKLDQLILSLDSAKQELYSNYQKMKELEEREKRERVHAIVAGMSHKAQVVFAKLSAVLMNPEMKDIDRVSKINEFYGSVDDDVKNEFNDKINALNWQ